MNYSPLLDALVTAGELIVVAVVAVNYIYGEIFSHRSAEMFRHGRMWGGR